MSSFPPPFNLQAAPTTGTKSDNTRLNRILERDLYIKLVTQMRVCVYLEQNVNTRGRIYVQIYVVERKKEKKRKKKKERAVTSLSTTGEEAKAVKFKVRNLLPPVVETRAGVKAPPSKSLLDEVSRGFFVPPPSSTPRSSSSL